jgi:hypothetical protein
MLFDFVRAAFAGPCTAFTDLSRRLRDGVSSPSLARNAFDPCYLWLRRNAGELIPNHSPGARKSVAEAQNQSFNELAPFTGSAVSVPCPVVALFCLLNRPIGTRLD